MSWGAPNRWLNRHDVSPPVITLVGGATFLLAEGETYVEPGFTAVDSAEGNIAYRTVVTPTEIVDGVGSVEYSVYDSAGNVTTAIRSITSTIPTSKVTMNILGKYLGATPLVPLTNADIGATVQPLTAPLTSTEIKTLYESNVDTNPFNDTLLAKLNGIQAGATVGGGTPTAAETKTAYESNANTNPFTDADVTKLGNIEPSATADQSNAEIKTAYEANVNTNPFTDTEQTKLASAVTSSTITTIVSLNQAAYDALSPPDATVLYLITP